MPFVRFEDGFDARAWLGLGLASLAITALARAVCALTPLERPRLGRRGERRTQALEHGLFRTIEPLLRLLGAGIARVRPLSLRKRLDAELERASYFLGLCGDELLALCALGFCAGGALAAVARAYGAGGLMVAGLCALGGATPFILMRDHRRGRSRAIERRMPTALDLFSLALNAGLDFGASIEVVASGLGVASKEPLAEELLFLRRELAFGSTRAQALASLAARVDVAAIDELARAVTQAQQKGTPLATVLEIQARIARNRRSVLAEEAAARAGVLLLLPVMVLVVALLTVLVGAFFIERSQA
jgi:tight adherence protein C